MRPSAKAARRYARAFFDLARREGCTEEALRDLTDLSRMADESVDLRWFLGNYLLPRARRQAVLEQLFRGGLHPLTWSFLRLLESQRRMGLLPMVRTAFGEWLDEAQGVSRAAVTSAFALEVRGEAAVREALRRRHGDNVRVTFGTDRRLLAGFVWQVGDTRCDRSVAGALAELRRKVAGA